MGGRRRNRGPRVKFTAASSAGWQVGPSAKSPTRVLKKVGPRKIGSALASGGMSSRISHSSFTLQPKRSDTAARQNQVGPGSWSGSSNISAALPPSAPTANTCTHIPKPLPALIRTVKTVAMVTALSSTVPPGARSCSTPFRQGHDGCRRQAHQPAVVNGPELNPDCYGRSAVRAWPPK
jgi:hypothetical protein